MEREAPKRSLEDATTEFWKYFREKVSEWNPCHIEEDGRVRYRWNEDVEAHDVEVELDVGVGASAVEVLPLAQLKQTCGVVQPCGKGM